METTRHAEVTWSGDLTTGSGTINYSSSGAFSRLPVTWASRTEQHNGRTSPEELLAAAHAACLSMSVASTLKKNGYNPVQTETSATCTFASKNGDGFEISRMRLHVRCEVPDIDEATFEKLVQVADENCPVANLLRNGLEIEITTALVQTHGA